MNRLIRIAALVLAANLAACSASTDRFTAIENTFAVVSQAKVPPEAIVTAASAFDVTKITATQWLRLPRCSAATESICRDPALMPRVVGAVQNGTAARNRLKAFLRQYPGELGYKGDYDALVTATDVIKDVTAGYRAAINK